MKRFVVLASLLLPLRALAIFGVADTGDAILAQILVQNIKNGLDISAQLAQLGQVVQTTRENYEFIRQTYVLANDLKNADPERVLARARQEFMASQPVFANAQALANDMARHGIRGGYGTWAIQRQIDVYSEDKEAERCGCDYDGNAPNGAPGRCWFICAAAHKRGWPFRGRPSETPSLPPPSPYDADAAKRLAAITDTVVYDDRARQDLLASKAEASATDGLVFNELATSDPSAAQALLRQRAVAAQAAAEANRLRTAAQRTDLNSGSAAVVTARSSALAAEQLAAIREAQAKQLALQQHAQTKEEIQRHADERQLQFHALHIADILYLTITGGAGRDQTFTADPYRP
jgi:hypothetical protein